MRDTIIQGDTLTVLKTLPDNLVDCVVTSPPYWGLRDYGVPGQLGLEPTIEEYIANMTEVYAAVMRVLKDTGTLWLNMGDSYNSDPCHNGKSFRRDRAEVIPSKRIPRGSGRWGGGNNHSSSLKPKDLCGMPWRLAFSLQAAGWYLRSDIIWHKPNPMPESVTDRPTKSHEYIFLLTKKAQYFYDAEAIKESQASHTLEAFKNGRRPRNPKSINNPEDIKAGKTKQAMWNDMECIADVGGRNKRTVWTIATQPCPEAHFATFPEKLVEPCIRAGTSERGNCAECGKPWVRVVEKTDPPRRDVNSEYPGKQTIATQKYKHDEPGPVKNTIGWRPSCSCDTEETVSPIVLDPFMGSGTVGLVAKKLNRDYIGIEFNPEYIKMAEKRIRGKMGLFVKGDMC